MTAHYLMALWNESDRKRAHQYIEKAPAGMRLEFREKKRSTDQNDRMWLMLGKIAKLQWHGQRYTDAEWKDYFMHAMRGEKWMPFEDGGMIPIGRSTSKLSKAEFGELMTLMEAFCARQGISLPWDNEAAA